MKRKLLILLFITFSLLLFAQAPDWQWATKAGGSVNDHGNGIAIDENGNSYVTGNFGDTTTFGSHSLTSNGYFDIFVAKLDIGGNWLWATQAGGSSSDTGCGIAIDENGNSYVTGDFGETITFGSYSLTSNGDKDIFIAKMDVNGNWLWAVKAGGNVYDFGKAIATDDNGNSYVTGFFEETAIFGSYTLTSSGLSDIFVAKIDANGNWLWVVKAGGNVYDTGKGIVTDDNGNSYVTGDFGETAIFGSYTLTSSGLSDIFVAKIDSNGNWLWAAKAGGFSSDLGEAIVIDDNTNSYVTGVFRETATFGSNSLTSSGSFDIFVTKLDSNGNCQWATKAGGISIDYGMSITIDDTVNTYITGGFHETATFGSYTLTSSGSDDIYIAKMDANGNWLWATQACGSGNDNGMGIAIDDNGNSYVTGNFVDTTTFGSYSLTSSGSGDIFVAKLGNETSVENEISPIKMELSNYPNPFNPTTTISFDIKENEIGILKIFNIKGQIIESHQFESGKHNYLWDASEQASGVYLYKLNINGKTEAVKKCLLMK